MHYLTPSPVHRRLGLICVGVGMQESPPVVGPRALDRYTALVVSAGSGWFSWGGREPIEVRAPILLWLLPGVEHHYGPHPDGWTECFMDFTGSATSAYVELGFIDVDNPVVPLASSEAAQAGIGRIAQVCRRGGPHLEVEAAALAHEVLITLRQSRADLDPHGNSVLRGLASSACLPLSVEQYARKLDMSVAELRHAVQRAAGCSPKEYVLTIRLNQAKELLATSDLPIASIARRVGYDDAAYFTRIFAKRVGVPPSEFRSQHARGALT